VSFGVHTLSLLSHCLGTAVVCSVIIYLLISLSLPKSGSAYHNIVIFVATVYKANHYFPKTQHNLGREVTFENEEQNDKRQIEAANVIA
jgi:lipopolysaccharide export LptBFGC system permease protein LptF